MNDSLPPFFLENGVHHDDEEQVARDFWLNWRSFGFILHLNTVPLAFSLQDGVHCPYERLLTYIFSLQWLSSAL
ncbi:hypothetical protein [Heyndrickxia acidiproducens]|uniref:hypothetical protein n=1 Tax=Heyndrickxia acidiproducens TaxID=1121084 RepID=UPI0003AB2BFB|nr:hypothetical protein [Heyndrickxia acidiproducens]